MDQFEKASDKAARSYVYNNGYRDDNRDRYEAFIAGAKWALSYSCYGFNCPYRIPTTITRTTNETNH